MTVTEAVCTETATAADVCTETASTMAVGTAAQELQLKRGEFVIAVIDADNAVAECDENNNIIIFGPLP